MKLLGSKLALPAISAVAVLTLIGVQAMALSQSSDPTPSNEVSTPAGGGSDTSQAADVSPSNSPTPIDIPEDQTTLPNGDDDFEDDGDNEDDESEDDSDDDQGEDDSDYGDDSEDDDEYEDD